MSRISRQRAYESARLSGVTNARLSADEWYSGYCPLGVRVKQPTARLKPGEQYCRSSYPYGTKSRSLYGPSPCLSTCAAARSTRVSPRRLRLYVSAPRAPRHDSTRPCWINGTRVRLSASHVIDPIV